MLGDMHDVASLQAPTT